MTTPHVVVVGGGITGLAAAATLRAEAARAGAPLSLTLLEGGATPGGHAQTTCAEGFVVESGPNGFLNREPHTLALIESLGLTSRLVEARPEAARRFIVRDGRLCLVPDGPAGLVTTPALSARGKLRLLAEPFAPGPPTDVDETVYDFAARRIGAEAAEMLVDAAVSGISAGDSRRLSVRAQFPVMPEMERDHGSLLRAMFSRRRPRRPRAKLVSFDRGMSVLTSALAARLGPDVRTSCTVRRLDRTSLGWRLTTSDAWTFDADHVVLAVPARTAAPMVADLNPALSRALGQVEYAGLAVVALAYRVSDVPRPLDGYGYLATRGEGMATLGVVWESSLFPGRAPEGHALLRVMIGGACRPDVAALPPGEVEGLARRELQQVLGITAAPVHAWTFPWPNAIAQYTVGHLDRRAAIAGLVAAHPGLAVCGTSYDGVSFNHAVKSGCEAAAAVAVRLWPKNMTAPATAQGVGA
jgi:oxygen-dependent protoporphyrinogen oxidase